MKKLYKGALIFSVGTVITKILGAIYRIPLTTLIGADGIGLYQMVFPFYTILLTLSSTGIPSALSKLIAEGGNGQKLVYKSIILFGLIGLIGSLTMFFAGESIAKLQGNQLAGLGYKMLSPSVFLVSILSCFRGYFQGNSIMSVTTLSQILEQVIKLAVALPLLWLLNLPTYQKAGICCLAVTISEFFATLYAFIKYKNSKILKVTTSETVRLTKLITITIPIAISSILIPLSRTIDSFLVLRLLPLEKTIATAHYGLYSGAVESLIGVPVAVLYGLSVSGLPLISKDKNNKKLGYKLIISTFLVSLIFALTFFLLKNTIVNILYFNLQSEEKSFLAKLIAVSSCNIVFLSLIQSLTAYLVAKDKAKIPPINLAIGVTLKVITLIILLPNPKFGIIGLAFSDILCYFVATILDLLYIIRCNKQKNQITGLNYGKKQTYNYRTWR